jgi:hypothetical protein
MKKVLEYGASKAAQRATYMIGGGPSIVAEEKEQKILTEETKVRSSSSSRLTFALPQINFRLWTSTPLSSQI